MKKYSMSLFLMIVSVGGLHAVDQSEPVDSSSNQEITLQDFVKNQIFKGVVAFDGLDAWNADVTRQLGIVMNGAGKNKVLTDYVTKVANANNDLHNGVKLVYNTIFAPAVWKVVSKKADFRRDKQLALAPTFNGIIDKMSGIRFSIDSQMKKSKSQKEKEMFAIIDALAANIITFAKNAHYSIAYYLAT